LIRGSVSIANPTRPELVPLPVSALADSGAVHLCIPEHLAIQLELTELERREVVLADGRRCTVPYVGPVEVRFGNRRCFTGAMVLDTEVLGSEVLLGAIPMEDMDLVLRPQLQSLEVNPESPNLPTSMAMRVEKEKHRAPIDAGSA
jgi:clan AA aspartic protease